MEAFFFLMSMMLNHSSPTAARPPVQISRVMFGATLNEILVYVRR